MAEDETADATPWLAVIGKALAYLGPTDSLIMT